jgi:hypothetical protein
MTAGITSDGGVGEDRIKVIEGLANISVQVVFWGVVLNAKRVVVPFPMLCEGVRRWRPTAVPRGPGRSRTA